MVKKLIFVVCLCFAHVVSAKTAFSGCEVNGTRVNSFEIYKTINQFVKNNAPLAFEDTTHAISPCYHQLYSETIASCWGTHDGSDALVLNMILEPIEEQFDITLWKYQPKTMYDNRNHPLSKFNDSRSSQEQTNFMQLSRLISEEICYQLSSEMDPI